MKLSHSELVELSLILDQVRREAVCPNADKINAEAFGLYCLDRDEQGNYNGRRFLVVDTKTKKVVCGCFSCLLK